MVELRKDVEFEGPVITGFTPSGFKVGEKRFETGLLISPEQALGWNASDMQDLTVQPILDALNLAPLPEFLLLGSGTNMVQPPSSFRRECEAAGFGVEVMDSKAAARAWGVLRAEERWIIGALLPIG